MTAGPRLCWVISDGRRGIENQALGLAEALAELTPLAVSTHHIPRRKSFAALTPLWQLRIKSRVQDYGLSVPQAQNISQTPITIGCGRQAIAPLLALKKSRPEVFTIYIQDPRIDPDRFDLVIAPEHDQISGPNVLAIIGAQNRMTPASITAQPLKASKDKPSQPRYAMFCIGGASHHHHFNPAVMAKHFAAARKLIEESYSLLVTTSRRTPDHIRKAWHEFSSSNPKVSLFDSHSSAPNPYTTFLAQADIILVTQDSTNMLTEAVTTGKTVFRLPMAGHNGKFQQLYDRLEQRCNVKVFNEYSGLMSTQYQPLSETQRAAKIAFKRIRAFETCA